MALVAMGRPPRIECSDTHYHVIVRCNNHEFRFEEEEDFKRYLAVLRFVKKKHGFVLFNYELMHSHVHLFLKPAEAIPLSKTMMLINWKFAYDTNRIKKRAGHLWLGRYRSIPVQDAAHSLILMRYINRNPIRAGMVRQCGEWKWSGYHFYAFGAEDDLLSPHPCYWELASADPVRQTRYRDIVSIQMPYDEQKEYLHLLQHSPYLGTAEFGRKWGFS